MMKRLYSLLIGLVLLGAVSAQSPVYVGGTLSGALGQVLITIQTVQGTMPATTQQVLTSPTGTFIDSLFLVSDPGWIQVSFMDCDSTIQYASASYQMGALGTILNFSLVYCNTFVDCLGVAGGTDLPGTPCDDNDSTTLNDTWDANCVCAGVTPTADCLGVVGGSALPGTPCDDMNPATTNDTWDMNCNCVGNNTTACDPTFVVTQAIDSASGLPIAGTLNVMLLNPNAFGFQFMWDFGDNTTSTSAYPQHTYSGNGPYLLCLTLAGGGCVSTYCDTVAVDTNGVIVPGQSGSVGFSINVVPNGANAVDEISVDDLQVFPNPSTGLIQIKGTIEAGASIEVYDINGAIMLSEQLNNGGAIDLSSLENGTYMIRLVGEHSTRVSRFVKVN